MTVLQLTDRVKSYVNTQLDSMSRTNPMISFMKPLVTRVLKMAGNMLEKNSI